MSLSVICVFKCMGDLSPLVCTLLTSLKHAVNLSPQGCLLVLSVSSLVCVLPKLSTQVHTGETRVYEWRCVLYLPSGQVQTVVCSAMLHVPPFLHGLALPVHPVNSGIK